MDMKLTIKRRYNVTMRHEIRNKENCEKRKAEEMEWKKERRRKIEGKKDKEEKTRGIIPA